MSKSSLPNCERLSCEERRFCKMFSSAGIGRAEEAEKACTVAYCHWIVVVLHQFLREIFYVLVLGPIYKIKWALTGRNRPAKPQGSVPGCTKRVIFVRHGQGDHNASLKGWQLCDPPLNATGEGQVTVLSGELKPHLKEVELIVVSQLTRAMQTATGGFAGRSPPPLPRPLRSASYACASLPLRPRFLSASRRHNDMSSRRCARRHKGAVGSTAAAARAHGCPVRHWPHQVRATP